ncbi:unnamed protein product [Prunus armeniaca]
MKTDEACTRRGMWCDSEMKRQRNELNEVTVTLRALDMFCKQLQLHLSHNIDEVTITLAVKPYQGDPKPGCQIHGFAVSSGFASYTTISNSLMCMYTKAGQFDGPLLIFETMCYIDIVSWNTILSGFRTSEGALNFALRMNFNGVVFYPVTYTTILAFCADHEDFLFGLQLHSLVFKSGLDGEVFVGNALTSMYSRLRRLIEARSVFDEMANEDLVSWNAILSGYSQEGNHGLEAIFVFIEMVGEGMGLDEEDVISLFNEMRLDGVYPNDATFVGLIHAISVRKLVEGEMIHGFCIKTGFLSKHNVCNSLIIMYAKLESMHDSIKVFEELNYREIISWNALISGYAQNGLCQDALKTFLVATMESKPNNYTFGSVLSAIGDARDISLKYGQ